MVFLGARCSDRDGDRIRGQKGAWARDRDKGRKVVSVQKWWPLALGHMQCNSQPWPLWPSSLPSGPSTVSWDALSA